MSDSFVTPQTVAHQAPLSMRFFRARVLEWGAIAFSGFSPYLEIKFYDEQTEEFHSFNISNFYTQDKVIHCNDEVKEFKVYYLTVEDYHAEDFQS